MILDQKKTFSSYGKVPDDYKIVRVSSEEVEQVLIHNQVAK